jgi:NAD(P)-dependent dehydrogenase (short-subunit alcohol dehydrogenase family)
MSEARGRKTIFITGAGSGIGRATAHYFAQRGWYCGLYDVNAAGIAETAADMPVDSYCTGVFDVRDRHGWSNAVSQFGDATGGRMHVLFNNAGIGTGGPLAELEVEEIDRCLDINLRGVLYGAQAAYPYLKASAPGSALVNIASAAGLTGGSGMSVYSATKFGVRGIAESLDAEWAPDGIKVSSICPSFIDTPLLDGTGNRNTNENIRTRVTAAGLEITPVEEVAQAVWNAVHGNELHYLVGKTARSLAFAKRWMPGKVRKQQRAAGRQGLLGK